VQVLYQGPRPYSAMSASYTSRADMRSSAVSDKTPLSLNAADKPRSQGAHRTLYVGRGGECLFIHVVVILTSALCVLCTGT
jgi:hypothetical protein